MDHTNYRLTLNKAERRAFDWIGDRYANGHDMIDALTPSGQTTIENPDGTPYQGEYVWPCELNSTDELTYCLTESQAWVVVELANKEDNLWPCFSSDLVKKMTEFCNRIV